VIPTNLDHKTKWL